MSKPPLDIPPEWDRLQLPGTGLVLVVGAPDTGKSTFARYLYQRLSAGARRAAFLDGDPGQSTLGPPATMTLAVGNSGDAAWPPRGPRRQRFVQAISPRGHMLSILVNAARLAQAARDAGAGLTIYDTSGLVDPLQGGLNLKLAKIELLQPAAVVAIQRGQELQALLAPLRLSRRIQLVELRPSSAVQPRDVAARQAHRAAQFGAYFSPARALTLDWSRLPVLPAPRFAFQQLAALEDVQGWTLALGIVLSADMRAKQVTLLTPLASPQGVEALRLGDMTVDPKTFRDKSET